MVEVSRSLGKLLDRVARGESIVITRRGVPVARLVPVPARAAEPVTLRTVFENLQKLDLRLPEGCTVRDLIDEGRKY